MYFSKPDWLGLVEICATLRDLLYSQSDVTKARTYLPRLEMMIANLPDECEALIHAEALSIYYELLGDLPKALYYRNREIDSLETLYQEKASGNLSTGTIDTMMEEPGRFDIDLRKQIVRRLEKEIDESDE